MKLWRSRDFGEQTMNPISKIHHVALKAADVTACGKFYSEILGLSLFKEHFYDDGSIRSVWFDVGGIILMLEKECPSLQRGSECLVAFLIPKSERVEWKNKLIEAGIEITHESEHSIYFSDPEGNRLALSHYGEK